MPKGGNGGGGKPDNGDGGGGGGKPNHTWGTTGNDTLLITDRETFKANIYDADDGIDTLDFSELDTEGITLSFRSNNVNKFASSLVNLDFAWFGYETYLAQDETVGAINDNIFKFENVIGSRGNDYLAVNALSPSEVYGMAGDDYLETLSGASSVLIGGSGADTIKGYHDTYSIGGDWNGTLTIQAGDGEADIFNDGGIILDFELGVDNLLLGLAIAQLEATLARGFVDGTWTDEFGITHEAAMLYDTRRGDLQFTIVGVSAEDANSVILPTMGFSIGGFEAIDGPIYGGTGNDFFQLRNSANEVVFLAGGGDDTLQYYDSTSMSPQDDILYFESNAPTSWQEWAHSTVNGVDVWTYDYGSGSATVTGLDAAAFQQLTFIEGLPEVFA